jgi:hypothetical protein
MRHSGLQSNQNKRVEGWNDYKPFFGKDPQSYSIARRRGQRFNPFYFADD